MSEFSPEAFSVSNLTRSQAADGFNMELECLGVEWWLAALFGELGEVASLAEQCHEGETLDDVIRTQARFGPELADVFIYLDLIATREGVPTELSLSADDFVYAHLALVPRGALGRAGFWEPVHWVAALAARLGQAANAAKKLSRAAAGGRGNKVSDTEKALREDLHDYLRAGVSCLVLMARSLGLDLGACVVAKFNEKSEQIGFPFVMDARGDVKPHSDSWGGDGR